MREHLSSIAPNAKDVILMKAWTNTAIPNRTPTELVEIPTFRHQHIASKEFEPTDIRLSHTNPLDIQGFNETVLDIRYPQVRKLNRSWTARLTSKSHPCTD